MINSENTNKRPKLKISYSLFEKFIELIGILGLILIIVITIFYYNKLPNVIPTHFNAAGKANGWGGKGSLIILPIIVYILYIGLTILKKYPHIYNYICEITELNAREQYQSARTMITLLKAELVYFFAYIQWGTIKSASTNSEGLSLWFLPITLIIIFGTIGYYIHKSIKAK